jgi:hypothetical protein
MSMTRIREKTLATFKSYVALIEELQLKAPNPLWFRGCGKGTHTLIPSLYRHRTRKAKAEIEPPQSVDIKLCLVRV